MDEWMDGWTSVDENRPHTEDEQEEDDHFQVKQTFIC